VRTLTPNEAILLSAMGIAIAKPLIAILAIAVMVKYLRK